ESTSSITTFDPTTPTSPTTIATVATIFGITTTATSTGPTTSTTGRPLYSAKTRLYPALSRVPNQSWPEYIWPRPSYLGPHALSSQDPAISGLDPAISGLDPAILALRPTRLFRPRPDNISPESDRPEKRYPDHVIIVTTAGFRVSCEEDTVRMRGSQADWLRYMNIHCLVMEADASILEVCKFEFLIFRNIISIIYGVIPIGGLLLTLMVLASLWRKELSAIIISLKRLFEEDI
nr:hypothetical protein [Tanacetum cinerariifolium]